MDKFLSCEFTQRTVVIDVGLEVSSSTIFEYKVEVCRRLDEVFKLHYISMSELKEYIDLSLKITLTFFSPFLQLLFGYHFNGKLGAWTPLKFPFINIGKRTLSQEMVHEYKVIPFVLAGDLFSLRDIHR